MDISDFLNFEFLTSKFQKQLFWKKGLILAVKPKILGIKKNRKYV